MKIDKSEISGTRFMFTIAFFLQSSALLTSFLAGVTKHESWLVIVFGIIVCLPLLYLYRTIMVMFPDKSLLQVLEEVYGKVAGKILGVFYFWFFLTLTSLNLTDLGDFVKVSVMGETPHIILILMCILVSVYAVRFGIKVVTRYGALFTVIEVAILILTIFLTLNQIKLQNFLPMFQLPLKKYIQGTHIIATIPAGELIIFLMITPNVKLTRKGATKYWFWGAGIGMLTLLIVMLRDIAILGNTLHLFTLPGLVTLRLVNLGESLSRMEILFAAALIMLLFFKITFLCYVTTITVAQLVNAKTFKHLALIVGILAVAYSNTLYPNPIIHAASARETVPIIWSIFEIIIPLITFIIAKIRKLPKVQTGMARGQEA